MQKTELGDSGMRLQVYVGQEPLATDPWRFQEMEHDLVLRPNAAMKQGKSAEDTATGAPARRLLFEEVLASPRGSYPPVSDEVQRFLACTKMADEDKRAAAALLARRRRAGRMERHSV